ncbi:hypothetical protein PAPYR_7642 [Paratrimastix pyriformis]|uniref:Uncharacterized protein n=1 Tax=Paratrimastix pyriformis TaxID=342808 RepID=A0ABQ8UCK9_9EUKA|nr:hypothetical protein PAPYR_7642 [Paratrimastix pyriformis]
MKLVGQSTEGKEDTRPSPRPWVGGCGGSAGFEAPWGGGAGTSGARSQDGAQALHQAPGCPETFCIPEEEVEYGVHNPIPLEDTYAFFFVAVSSPPPPCVVRAFADTVREVGFGPALEAGRFKLLYLDLVTRPDEPRLVDATMACASPSPLSPFTAPKAAP